MCMLHRKNDITLSVVNSSPLGSCKLHCRGEAFERKQGRIVSYNYRDMFSIQFISVKRRPQLILPKPTALMANGIVIIIIHSFKLLPILGPKRKQIRFFENFYCFLDKNFCGSLLKCIINVCKLLVKFVVLKYKSK